MGMCASQARLLSLTALKSDLELQAQMINNNRLALSRSQETIANEYNEKINNKKLTFRVVQKTNTDSSDTYTTWEDLDITRLLQDGNYIITFDDIVEKNGDAIWYSKEGEGTEYKVEKDGTNTTVKTYQIKGKHRPIDAKYLSKSVGEDHNAFQYALLNGTAKLYKKSGDTYKEITIADDSSIKEEYDDSDDAQAKSKYDSETKKVETKDKALELQLEQIETRHKAVETEIESVQKIIDSNVESSYKTFSRG